MTAWFDQRDAGYGIDESGERPTSVYLALVDKYWKPLVGFVVAVMVATLLYSQLVLTASPVFESAATIDIAPSSEEIGYANRFSKGSPLEAAEVVVQTYAEYIRSRPIAAEVVRDFIEREAGRSGQSAGQVVAALHRRSSQPSLRRWLSAVNSGEVQARDPLEALVDDVVESTTVATVAGTYLLRVEVAWDDRDMAAWFANRLAERLVAQASANSRSPGARIASEIDARLGEANVALATARDRARAIKASLGVVDLDRQRQALIDERTAAETKVAEDQAQIAALEAQVASLQRAAGGRLSASQLQVEQTLALERPRLAGLKRSVAERGSRVARIGRQLGVLTERESLLDTLEAEIVAHQAEVTTLMERRNFAALDNLASRVQIRILEPAVPADARSSPKVLLNTALGGVAATALAGLFLLAAAGFRRPPIAPAPPSGRIAPGVGEQAIFGSRCYPGLLSRPADGRHFSAEESRVIGLRLDNWLAAPLVQPAKALSIVAAGIDRDAWIVGSLLRAHLARRGERAELVDRRAEPTPLPGGGRRPIVVCGGLRSGSDLAVLAGHAAVIVYRPNEQRAEDLAILRHEILARTGEEPFAIAIAG